MGFGEEGVILTEEVTKPLGPSSTARVEETRRPISPSRTESRNGLLLEGSSQSLVRDPEPDEPIVQTKTDPEEGR